MDRAYPRAQQGTGSPLPITTRGSSHATRHDRADGTNHRALKEAAAREGRSIRTLIEERLASERGLSADRAREIVARAQSVAGLGDEEAMAIAVRETRFHRAEKDG